MRCALSLALLALAAWPVAAQDNEAEKLYREMEKKVRAAKTLHVRFDLNITDALGKTGTVKGTLTLGEGDKYRVDLDGKIFGQTVKGTEVSDGTRVKVSGNAKPSKDDEKPPAGVGAYYRAALPHEGFFMSSLNSNRRADRPPDAFHPADFKLAGTEKIAGRDTQIIQYTVTFKGGKDPLPMKLWLDAKTHLPVKLAVTGGKSDVTDVTETYREFTVDPKVDAKAFELSK
jgi:outer membrane lipoprotein-sorting protein